MCSSRQFLVDRINAKKQQLVAMENAALSLATGGIESYQLDTGQTTQRVTKLNIDSLYRAIDALMNQIVILENRLGNSGTIIARPGW